MIDDTINDGKTIAGGGKDVVLAGRILDQLVCTGGVEMAHVIKLHRNLPSCRM